MGMSRVSLLVEQLFSDTPLGCCMRVCIEDIVLDSGRFGLVWQMPFDIIRKYIDDHNWIFSVLAYNHKYNIQLNSHHRILKGCRVSDKSIMTTACMYYNTISDLKSINRVRQGNKCNSLIEICSADGLSIDVRYVKEVLYSARRNDHKWPTKTHITTKDHRIWKALISCMYKEYSCILIEPLGNWDICTDIEWLDTWD